MEPKNTLMVSTRKGLVIYQRNGNNWTVQSTHFEGIPVTFAMRDNRTDTLWVGLDHGHWGCKVHSSTDGGANWNEVAAPAYPEGAEVKEGVPAKLEYIWAMAAGGEDQPGRLYIGTVPGGMFQSDDNGKSWSLVEGLWNHPSRKDNWFGGGMDHPGIHSIIVDPNDSQHIFIGISCAGVFETKDGGTTWHPRNKGLKADFLPDASVEVGHDPHLLVAHPNNLNLQWQQNHCGIFNSQDGGANWADISESDGPANFGFAIAVDETNEKTAWVVPALSDTTRVAVDKALCVCRTEDGGQSWQALRKGLPQDNCFDIVFRHALDVTGNNLVFGTTTGNLYTSNNRGDDWQVISHNLPPVYAVKFV